MCIDLNNIQSIILAGGSGTRLRPLTCDIPKPLAPICGNPCIYYILNLLKTHGINETCITLNYKGESICNVIVIADGKLKEDMEISKHNIDGNEVIYCKTNNK